MSLVYCVSSISACSYDLWALPVFNCIRCFLERTSCSRSAPVMWGPACLVPHAGCRCVWATPMIYFYSNFPPTHPPTPCLLLWEEPLESISHQREGDGLEESRVAEKKRSASWRQVTRTSLSVVFTIVVKVLAVCIFSSFLWFELISCDRVAGSVASPSCVSLGWDFKPFCLFLTFNMVN